MAIGQSEKSWEHYERMVACLIADQLETEFCVTPNTRMTGRISGRSRQIDVLIDSRHETDNSRRIIVDAKRRKRKIDVTHVEAFRGLMEDVGATHGYLVCPAGYTEAALKRAQVAVSIRIVPLDSIEDFDPATWPECQNPRCRNGRVFWDGYPECYVALHPLPSSVASAPLDQRSVHYVGKCDRCGRFHVRCLTCDDLLSVPENDENDHGHQCSCKPLWFWLASIEEDEHRNKSAELHLIFATGEVRTVDRRSY